MGKEAEDMMQERQVELSLEMEAGDFSVRVAGVTMNVRLKGGNGSAGGAASPLRSESLRPALPELSATPEGETHRLAQEAACYRRISEEIYTGLGKLAKEINLSLQDLSLAEIIQGKATSPGERLDQARLQLNDVLAMTERATLDILDLVEQIRGDCRLLEEVLASLAAGSQPDDPAGQGGADLTPENPAEVLRSARELGDLLRHLTSKPPAGSPGMLRFSLADTLQMLLESCGTEAVKPHLKSLLAQQAVLFSTEAVERALSRLAAQAPVEAGFHQVPVVEIIKVLKDHCEEERSRELLAKLLRSAGKIFPGPDIPLEGYPAPAPAPEETVDLLPRWEAFMRQLESALQNPGGPGGQPAPGRTVEAQAATGRIQDSLSRITEALSFQDLSGQRLLKVMKILRQVQAQVLTLLVATGHKLKMVGEGQELSLQECEALAQEELLRTIHHLPPTGSDGALEQPPPVDQEPLDQEAINALLAGLGF